MSKVLDGGDGVTSGGNEDRARDSGVVVLDTAVDLGDGDGEIGGEFAASMLVRFMVRLAGCLVYQSVSLILVLEDPGII